MSRRNTTYVSAFRMADEAMLERAYALIEVKSLDAERRVIAGIATTPTPDRVGDIVEPKGAQFQNPLPLLLHHDSRLPVGTATFGAPTDQGIPFEARFPEIDEPGPLRDRVSEAWQSVKSRLIRGVSIGFRVLEDGCERLKDGGYRFTKTEILELSLVAIPANAEATIQTIKSLDSAVRAASGNAPESASSKPTQPGAAGVSIPKRARVMKKSISDQIADLEAKRAANVARVEEIQAKAAEEGRTKDAAEQEEFDTLEREVESIDKELVDLRKVEQMRVSAAKPVSAATQKEAAQSRSDAPVVTVKSNLPPGIEFARAVLAKVAGYLEMRNPVEIARERYPDQPRIQQYLKAAVPAANTQTAVYLGNLIDPTNLASEFIEYLRPMTIIGKFGTGNIPSLRRVPFNIRVMGQVSGSEGYWVGEGRGKPLTTFQVSPTTLGWAKVANIAVITEELARFSSPSAEALVRDELARAIIERIDTDFVDPAKAAVPNVSPASITNGLTPLTSAGTSADNARADIRSILGQFILANIDPTNLVLLMPNTLALALSTMTNALGQAEFPELTMRGGSLLGIPVITSQYVANQSGAGNMVIAVNASDIFLADDGQVTVDMSREASLAMSDAPSSDAKTGTGESLVSMWQTNSIALRAERYINWARRRSDAVVYMDDVNWGSVGSPS